MGCGIQSRPSLPPPMLLLSDLELCQLQFVSHIHRCCSDIQTTTASVFLSLLWNMSGKWWWRSINQEVDHVLPSRRGHARCLYICAQTWKSHATTRGDRIGQHFPWALLKTRSQLMGNCFRYVVAAMTLGEKWQRGWGSWYVVKTQVKLTLTGKDCQLEKGNSCLSKMVQKEHF